MPNIDIDGTELYYERRGAGEPLLLIQGLGGHSAHWGEPFLSELERDFDVVVYDQRGAGRSAPFDGDLTTGGLAADALALLERNPWPGNVRELRNAIERALAYSPRPTILRAAPLTLGMS